jgi:antitoxin MazE
MDAQIAMWGNSLAVRLPSKLAAEAQLRDGEAVKLSVEDGRVIIESKRRYVLSELLAQITPENRHEALDVGGPVGNEIW